MVKMVRMHNAEDEEPWSPVGKNETHGRDAAWTEADGSVEPEENHDGDEQPWQNGHGSGARGEDIHGGAASTEEQCHGAPTMTARCQSRTTMEEDPMVDNSWQR